MNIPPDLFSNLISNLAGTIIGALLAYWIARKQFRIQKDLEIQQQRVDMALAFYEELTSDDFSRARSEADKIFKEHRTASSLNDFYADLPEEKKQYIRMVTSYFRRLQLAIEYKRIDNQMVLDLLSGEFFWWYFMWLDKMTMNAWRDTRKSLDKMDEWLQNTMPKTDYEQLKESAIKRREKRLAELQSNQPV